MPDYKKSALLCIRITRVLLLVLAATLFAMPPFVKWYAALRLLSRTASTVLLVAFYLCTIPAGLALCAIHKLLTNICADRVFLADNARLVSLVLRRRVRHHRRGRVLLPCPAVHLPHHAVPVAADAGRGQRSFRRCGAAGRKRPDHLRRPPWEFS